MRAQLRSMHGRWRTTEILGAVELTAAGNGTTSLGTTSSGGEADVNSQYTVKHDNAGGHRRHLRDGIIDVRALLRGAGAALAAALLAAAAPTAPSAQAQEPEQPHGRIVAENVARTSAVMVTVGKSQDVRTERSFADVMVSDPSVADVSPLTDHSLSILGKKIGATRITVYDHDHQPVQIFDITVSYDLSGLAIEIAHFAGSGIKITAVGSHIMLSGTAPDAATLDKAMLIARQFDKDAINTVQVMQQQQVMLEVRFIEVDRSASRELGVQWNVFGGSTTANIGSQLPANQLPVTSASSVTAAGVLSGAAPYGFLVSQLTNQLQVAVNALEQRGLARSLAEPNLVALSGDTASFLAGGQLPIPEAGSFGTISFAYQPYGVGLSFTPTVLRDGLINLIIKPEVSEIDTTHTVTVLGTSVPGLITRKASTTLELRDGQSFMLGGLLQNTSQTAADQLPWLGDMPVLGSLFRSAQYQKNETDLVIVVTPHIVRPMSPVNEARTPLDNTLPANDMDFFLMGRAEVSPALVRLAAGAVNRPFVGHILDLPKKGGVYVSVKD
jgi:pilus assembly protein CpaC